MDENEATQIYDELFAIMKCGPGRNPNSFRRAMAILDTWQRHSDAHIKERVFEASGHFTTWFSADKWKGKDNGRQSESNVIGSITALRDAIGSFEQRSRKP